jgi:polysaccharide pyruvyl transferase WcaK-like protein
VRRARSRPGKLHFVPDAVFVHEVSFFNKQAPPPGQTDKLKIALNLNYNIENPANWDTFIDNLARSLRDFQRQQPLEIHALPMQMGFKDHDDLQILTAFRSKIEGIDLILHQSKTPQEIGQIIAACDVVVAERLHTLIIAAILHKPSLALMYDVKVRELVNLLEIDDFAIDINHPFDPATLTQQLLALTAQQQLLIAHLQLRTSELRQQLGRYFQSINQQISRGSDKQKMSNIPEAFSPLR